MRLKIEKFFQTDIPTTREGMIKWIFNHPRYFSANSWNQSTTFGHNVKFYKLGLTTTQLNHAYTIIDEKAFGYQEFWDKFQKAYVKVAYEFLAETNSNYAIGLNKGKYLNIYEVSSMNEDGTASIYPYRGLWQEDFRFYTLPQIRYVISVIKALDKAADKLRSHFIHLLNQYIDAQVVIQNPE